MRHSVNAGKRHKDYPPGALRTPNPFDLDRITPQDLEELIVHLNDLTVEVEGKEKVRVYCG